ncbi:MAG: hypothetical protein O8C66_06910 [Candidatus Methanoperedens sp.]|nr:hypothetical protein [Candidatus Methanoperedens sp.]MCZ7370223.1 hypothetical protein [Candidatus Methanoperedens sp.]
MSTERDIIIERLEQKLAARDLEIEKMQESWRESIIAEMEKRFTDKIKLRESTLDDLRQKFGEKASEIIEMNKSLRDSVLEQRKSETDVLREAEKRMERIERRLMELNSSYDGVMKELLDQKSILQELKPKKPPAVREEPKPKETKPREEVKPLEKPRPKGEYIIAENYVPKDKRKQQAIIEADDVPARSENKPEEKPLKRQEVRKSESVKEGVVIFETPKKR